MRVGYFYNGGMTWYRNASLLGVVTHHNKIGKSSVFYLKEKFTFHYHSAYWTRQKKKKSLPLVA